MHCDINGGFILVEICAESCCEMPARVDFYRANERVAKRHQKISLVNKCDKVSDRELTDQQAPLFNCG